MAAAPLRAVRRWLQLTLLAALVLQAFFIGRIALMAWVDPQSTAMQRSEMWRLAQQGQRQWAQQWVSYDHISEHLKRAVITAEDDGFAHHEGVDLDAMEKAWQRNAQAEEAAANHGPVRQGTNPVRLRGGSTITQQLAKNLLLSGERTLLRKGQELALALTLELLLDKRRILEIYLNHVEWGEGIFGAEAAARRYFGKSAAQLTPHEAARLAVMLPAPRRYEQNPQSAYLASRSRAIAARMAATELP